jgi:hypothetical protein
LLPHWSTFGCGRQSGRNLWTVVSIPLIVEAQELYASGNPPMQTM